MATPNQERTESLLEKLQERIAAAPSAKGVHHPEEIELIAERIVEAMAIQDMASRMRIENEEDSEVLKAAARVTWRLLADASQAIGR